MLYHVTIKSETEGLTFPVKAGSPKEAEAWGNVLWKLAFHHGHVPNIKSVRTIGEENHGYRDLY